MRKVLSRIKSSVGVSLKNFVMKAGLPLNARAWIVQHLPLDYWRKSVAYQQCLADRVIENDGAVVQAGPFKGMKYLDDAEEGCLVPKLLGCYEEELAAIVENFIQAGCDRVVDVGCASGYYVAGMSKRLPKAEVFAFDTDESARQRCARVIALNQLESRVKLGGFCAPAELETLIKGRTLLIIDCEGGEFDLLDPAKVPSLSRCDMLIEIHDFINPKISATLRERFQDSHEIERIVSKKRDPSPANYPGLKALPAKHWSAAIDERRPGVMDWLILRSKQHVTRPVASVAGASDASEV